jgi:hypothetical protein
MEEKEILKKRILRIGEGLKKLEEHLDNKRRESFEEKRIELIEEFKGLNK